MKIENLQLVTRSEDIVGRALNARTVSDVDEISLQITSDIGAKYERPVGDRASNHGLMGAGVSSYDALLVEVPINGVDSVIEAEARRRYPNKNLADLQWESPRQAVEALFAGRSKEHLGQYVQLRTFAADPHPSKSKLITAVVRDHGVGLTPKQIPETIFHLGSKYKDSVLWLHGAYGLGGAMTFRNAERVVLVTRRQPELLADGEEDLISVAVCEWKQHVKGTGLYYLTTTAWPENEDAACWSTPAANYPEFDPGLHLALISYGTKKVNSKRSGRDSVELMLQTRLPDPVMPIGVHNHVARRDHFKVPEGNLRVFNNNPRKDRLDGNGRLLIEVDEHVYKLPVRWHVFMNGPNADIGGMRTFVWDLQAVLFTSNGQAHKHWSQQELRSQAPKLSQLWNRLHVVVDVDPLPITERVQLFTPDRSTFRDTDVAEILQRKLANYLETNKDLDELNGKIIRQKLSEGRSERSTRSVANKIAKALEVRGFGFAGRKKGGRNAVDKPRKRPPAKLYPNPTTLEGPVHVLAVPGSTRHIELHLNAQDNFIPNRGRLDISSSEPDVTPQHFDFDDLRKGRLRLQLAVPAKLLPGTSFQLNFQVKDWLLAAGGLAVNGTLKWQTQVRVVEKYPDRKKVRKKSAKPKRLQKGQGKSEQPAQGNLVAVLWKDGDTFEDWNDLPPINRSIRAEDFPIILNRGRSSDEAQAIYRRADHFDLERAGGGHGRRRFEP